MEMEGSQMLLKPKLEFFDMLKEALMIPYRSISFTFLAFCTSLPLLCFMVFFETTLQRTLIEASNILKQPSDYYFYDFDYWPGPFYSTVRFTSLSPKLIQLCFLYLVPYHLLELFNMVVIVHMAQKIYKGEAAVTFRGTMHKLLCKISLKGCFITSIYVRLLSTSILFGMIWLVTNYSILSVSNYKQALLTILHGAAFLALLFKYLDWSAGWNMGIVISILEEVCGIEALELSAYYSRGRTQQGQLLMLVFFVWGLGLRPPCLCAASGIAITSAVISLVCLRNVVKWVACMVYFYDCKSRILEKKVDDKFAGEASVLNSIEPLI